MSESKEIEIIKRALDIYFSTNSTSVENISKEDLDLFSELDIIVLQEDIYRFNFSDKFQTAIFEISGTKFNGQINSEYAKLYNYFEEQKNKYGFNNYKAYEELIKSQLLFFLIKFNDAKQALNLGLKLIGLNIHDELYFHNVEYTFMEYFSSENLDRKLLFEYYETIQKNENKRYLLSRIIIKQIELFPESALELYNLNDSNDVTKTSNIQAQLNISLFNSKLLQNFDLLLSRLNDDLSSFYFKIFSGLILDEVQKTDLLSKLETLREEEYSFDFLLVIQNILNAENLASDIIDKSFTLIHKLISSNQVESSQIAIIVSHVNHSDDRKFEVLLHLLGHFKDFKIIKDYFYQFSSPKYVFDLIKLLCRNQGVRISTDLFENAISHFRNNFPSEVNSELMLLFHPSLQNGITPVLFLSKFSSNVNFLEIEDENTQLNVIRKVQYSFYGFDKLLIPLIELRKSKHKSVVSFLQLTLINLVHKAYGDKIIEWIEETGVSFRKEKKFFDPIIEATNSYLQLKAERLKYNDYNPYYNEREFIDQYYSLEKESQDEMMDDRKSDPSFLLSLFKGTSIIRGNSFKVDGQNEVRPLGKFESSITIDLRMYRNPELYEFTIKNLDNYES